MTIYIHSFDNIQHLKTIILEDKQSSSSKWLIFVESIDDGTKLRNQLVEENDDCKISAEDVVFIDAKYEQDEDAVESVLELSEKKLISRKIIISTSVLDNGVSFQDMKLRNIVITADNKEEFVQMLGRKREDQQTVELFIQRRDKEFFRRRYQSIDSILRTYDKFENDFRCIYGDDVDLPTYWYSCMEEKKIQPKDQQNMLKYIMSNSVLCRHFTKFAFALGGFIALNSISIDRLMRLKIYYKEIVQRLAEDPDAFLKLQLNWLGKNEEEIVSIINDCKTKGFEDCVAEIKKMVIPKLDIIMDKQTNIVFRNEMEKECRRLIDICDKNIDDTVKSRCKRVFKDRECPISAPVFNALMEIANLPYIMKYERNQGYTISEK